MKKIIVLSGRIGSGKTSISHWLANQIPATRAGFGDYVRYLTRSLRLDATNRKVLQEVGALMAQYPEDFCAGFLNYAGYQSGTPLVVDGIRHIEVLDALRRQVAPIEVVLVFLDGDPAATAKRVTERDGTSANLALFEQHSTEIQVQHALRCAAQVVIQADTADEVTVAEIGSQILAAF